MKTRISLLVLFSILILTASESNSASNSLPPAISTILETKYKNMKVMGAEDIDNNECDVVKGANGVIRGDFNGDGTEDLTMFLRAATSHRKENGDLFRYCLIGFFSKKDKGYEPKLLAEVEDFYPPVAFITLRKAGKIKDFESEKITVTKNPAIELTYCGKSVVTYFWKGKKFTEIWISD